MPIGEQQTQISHRLEGTEEKLRNRESRPEDLHVIAELREMVSEREALVKKLVVSRIRVLPTRTRSPTASSLWHINTFVFQDDKKFYQLELVNRETGFSKVFNSSANVGVINPLIKVSGLQSRSSGDDGCFLWCCLLCYHPLIVINTHGKSLDAKVFFESTWDDWNRNLEVPANALIVTRHIPDWRQLEKVAPVGH